jgi:phosphatidylserine/phosphatidylglycerophosphate/cardiolipin synthase-like enzyme
MFALAGCQEEANDIPDPGVPAASLSPADWYTVYFTDPQNPTSKTYRGGPDQDLAQAIRRARLSVDIAVLQLNLWSVRDALLEAHRSGVRVRMVTESDYLDEREVQQLIEAGIPVIGDRGEGLMHNKFVVIDRLEVWTGSMNFTVSEGYRNNNTLIRLRSPELAENYSLEFEEMFTDDRFGQGSPANTPHPDLVISGTPVQSCFGPEDGCTERLVRLISAAQQEVVFLAYSFTSDELAAALIERFSQGVSVRGVMEASQVENRGTDLARMLTAGLDVRLDGNPDQMHAKVMVIDGRLVGMGSFNFTYSAETRNDENLLIIDDPRIAEMYLAEFERIFDRAQE